MVAVSELREQPDVVGALDAAGGSDQAMGSRPRGGTAADAVGSIQYRQQLNLHTPHPE